MPPGDTSGVPLMTDQVKGLSMLSAAWLFPEFSISTQAHRGELLPVIIKTIKGRHSIADWISLRVIVVEIDNRISIDESGYPHPNISLLCPARSQYSIQ